MIFLQVLLLLAQSVSCMDIRVNCPSLIPDIFEHVIKFSTLEDTTTWLQVSKACNSIAKSILKEKLLRQGLNGEMEIDISKALENYYFLPDCDKEFIKRNVTLVEFVAKNEEENGEETENAHSEVTTSECLNNIISYETRGETVKEEMVFPEMNDVESIDKIIEFLHDGQLSALPFFFKNHPGHSKASRLILTILVSLPELDDITQRFLEQNNHLINLSFVEIITSIRGYSELLKICFAQLTEDEVSKYQSDRPTEKPIDYSKLVWTVAQDSHDRFGTMLMLIRYLVKSQRPSEILDLFVVEAIKLARYTVPEHSILNLAAALEAYPSSLQLCRNELQLVIDQNHHCEITLNEILSDYKKLLGNPIFFEILDILMKSFGNSRLKPFDAFKSIWTNDALEFLPWMVEAGLLPKLDGILHFLTLLPGYDRISLQLIEKHSETLSEATLKSIQITRRCDSIGNACSKILGENNSDESMQILRHAIIGLGVWMEKINNGHVDILRLLIKYLVNGDAPEEMIMNILRVYYNIPRGDFKIQMRILAMLTPYPSASDKITANISRYIRLNKSNPEFKARNIISQILVTFEQEYYKNPDQTFLEQTSQLLTRNFSLDEFLPTDNFCRRIELFSLLSRSNDLSAIEHLVRPIAISDFKKLGILQTPIEKVKPLISQICNAGDFSKCFAFFLRNSLPDTFMAALMSFENIDVHFQSRIKWLDSVELKCLISSYVMSDEIKLAFAMELSRRSNF